jgi:hypothetical protein
MKRVVIDDVLESIRADLDLSRETEYELLEEIRTHLEDAVADAVTAGKDKELALLKAAEKFGVAEVGGELQRVHVAWESADAIVACALPVLAALILRWLIFAPDGSALGWPELLARPAFWIVAVVALLVPLLQFRQWRYALVGWGLFWILSVIFVAYPAIRNW